MKISLKQVLLAFLLFGQRGVQLAIRSTLELAKQGIEIVGIDYKDERTKAMKFLMNYGNPFKAIVYDPKGSLGLDLGVYGAPETFIIDGNGTILYRHAGDVNENVWNETLKPIYDNAKAQ